MCVHINQTVSYYFKMFVDVEIMPNMKCNVNYETCVQDFQILHCRYIYWRSL